MDRRPASPDIAAQVAAAFDWWREAGVDSDYADEPTDWLAEEAAEEAPAPPPPPAPTERAVAAPAPSQRVASPRQDGPIGGDLAGWPTTLEAFREWWLTEPSLDAGGVEARVAPVGKKSPRLMVVVPEPASGEVERVPGGVAGRMLDAFLDAAGVAQEVVYFASALPRHTPLPDWTQLAADGLGAVLAHHVGLVAPERLLVLGRDVLPLLGHDTAQAAPDFRQFSHDGTVIPALAAEAPDSLLRSARMRARLWRRWLDWTDT